MKTQNRILKPQDVHAFDPGEFNSALSFAAKVLQEPTPPPKITDIDGVRRMQTETPRYRLWIELRKQFPSKKKRTSFMLRFVALSELVRSDVFSTEYVERVSEDCVSMQPRVIELASAFPLNPQLRFDAAAFLAALRQRFPGTHPPS